MRMIPLDKLKNAIGNSFWQLIPSIAVLLLSLVVVRLFSAATWGIVVGIVVIQQIACSIVAWGNKDFLQRELAQDAAGFARHFSILFRERFFLFMMVWGMIFLSGIIDSGHFVSLSFMIFGRFLQQSFDILIIKERRFALAVWLEVFSLAAQMAGIWVLYVMGRNDLNALLMLFWLPLVIKGVVLSIVFRGYFIFGKAEGLLLSKSFSFAMLSLTGLIHTKIDLVLVSATLNHETLGKYQIITAFLWNIQSVALYVSSPYIHNFYRLNPLAQRNYSRMLKRVGSAVVPVGVMAMAVILHFAFQIGVNATLILASLLFGAMPFIYLPWIFQLNQHKRENRVLFINISGIIVLVVLMLSANAIWGLTLERTVWIVTIHQLFLTLIAFMSKKNAKVCLQS